MIIDRLRINHIQHPIGYRMDHIVASYRIASANGKFQSKARIRVYADQNLNTLVYDTGEDGEINPLGTELLFSPMPVMRYYWQVEVWDDTGDYGISEIDWFETGKSVKEWGSYGIMADFKDALPVFFKEFSVTQKVMKARLYICGVGIFQAYLNGKRVGDELFTPYLNAYHSYIQYITFDVKDLLKEGKNFFEVELADGWYCGNYGYRQNPYYREGKQKELLLNLEIVLENGEHISIISDESWMVRKNTIEYSDIYNGEVRDDTVDTSVSYPVLRGNLEKYPISERLSMPVRVVKRLCPKRLFYTPSGELVLDMGQNMTGRISFYCRGKLGDKYLFQHGEILQDGNFYRENYRTAKAEYVYVSDGKEKWVSPQFTFYGFQYVKIICFKADQIEKICLEDFVGEVISSNLEQTGSLVTGNQVLNQLISNIFWSQIDNFLDIPSDCPQRDERLGWTGDAQIFAGTACLNMECYAFYRKYLYDLALEQKKYGGLVPQIVPALGSEARTSAAWGDAAVLLPWTLFCIYGDKSILYEQYSSMKEWISYIDGRNRACGTASDLWQNDFHYGDWLAMDGGCYHMPVGGTATWYISSAYFYLSTLIISKVAEILGYKKESQVYLEKANDIKTAIIREYFTSNGKLCMDTQTGYLVALKFGIYKGETHRKRLIEDLKHRIRMDQYRLKTGFVGTPFLLHVLSEAGENDLACRMLMEEGIPGWLYQVKMGATTVWERWDSVDSEGHMSDNGMNSLNHYANGSVLEWMYAYLGGIRQEKSSVGYRKVVIDPYISKEISKAETILETASGIYQVHWHISEADMVYLKCYVPFGCSARICFSHVDKEIWEGPEEICVTSGEYEFSYPLKKNTYYSINESVYWLIQNPEIKEYLYRKIPMLEKVDGARIQDMTLMEMSHLPFFLGIGTNLGLEDKVLKDVEEFLSTLKAK